MPESEAVHNDSVISGVKSLSQLSGTRGASVAELRVCRRVGAWSQLS
jgi:hypothetical protein